MVFYLVVYIIFLRSAAFDIGQISSDSMFPTIKSGDWVIIDKISFGLSFPVSIYEIPWISYFSTATEKELWNRWKKKNRILKFSIIQRGDIVIFKLPTNTKTQNIKRIIGIPGETLTIGLHNSLNHKMSFDSMFYQYKYYFYRDHFGINSTYLTIDTIPITIPDVSETFESFKNFSGEDHIDFNLSNYFILYGWRQNNFGPLYVPEKGGEISLNDSTFNLYKQELTLYEGNEIFKKDSIFICNGKQIRKYKFKYDYYFVLGDNIAKSYDSRYYGLIPFYLIIGKMH